MAREHSLMIVLSVIVIINVVAIVLLSQKMDKEERLWEATQNGEKNISPIIDPNPTAQKQLIRTQPLVRTLILEDNDRCPRCWDIDAYVNGLNDTIHMDIERAPYEEFGLPRLPALAFNATLESYPALLVGWENTGYITTIETGAYAGKWYVLPTSHPPYYDLYKNTTQGIVNVTFITKVSCAECYDPADPSGFLAYYLATLNVTYDTTIIDTDSSAGKRIITMYNITAVPTMLTNAQIMHYRNLQPVWNITGTVEKDGTHILRDLQRFEVVYYDLVLAKLMKP